MKIAAFDLSLTCVGFADGHRSGVLVPPATANRGVERLRWIRNAVLRQAADAQLVVLEGYSFASRGRAIVSLGELGGVVRCALTDAAIAWLEIAPSSRALFATGKGNAGKPEVLAAAIRELGYEGHSYDEVDALWLRAMALEHYAPSAARLNEKRRKALAAIAWPVLPIGAPHTPRQHEER